MVLSSQKCGWILIAALGLLPFLLFLALRLDTNTNDMLNWVPGNTQQSQIYDKFTELFGEDDELILSWDGCTIDDPRLAELEMRLNMAKSSSELFSDVNSGRSVLNQMAGTKFSYSEAGLKRRLRGVVFDAEDQTLLMIQLSEKGKRNGDQSISEIVDQVEATEGLNLDDIRIAGNAYTNFQLDQSTQKTLLLSFPAILMAMAFTFFCLRSIRLTVASMLAAGVAGLLSVSLIALFGAKFNCLLVMMPVLVIVLTFSATIHLSSYYKSCLRANHTDPVNGMLQIGCRPCLLAILTTAVGIVMLATSQIQAICGFGLFTAMGLCASLSCILLLFPAILKFWRPGQRELLAIRNNGLHSYFNIRIPGRTAAWYANAVVLVCLATIPVFAIGLTKIESRLLAERMFSRKSKVSRNTKWLANRFSSVHSVDAVISFPQSVSNSNLVDEIRQLRSVQAALSRLNAVESTVSIVNFCRLPDSRRSASSFVESKMINESLKGEFQQLIDRRLVAESEDRTYWRIRLGVDADFASEVELVLRDIDTRMNQAIGEIPGNATGLVTGAWPLYTFGRLQMFTDLANSFVLAFVVITPIVMLLTGGIWSGLIAMVPNVFPALAFFGSLGWLGIEIDTGTILTACVGLGIAVDDTLHYIHEYVRIRKTEKLNRTLGAFSAVSSCVRPMSYTTIICTIGLSVFIFSEFLPAQNFAIAICFLLGLALICDILFLPALIIGPLGKAFECKHLAESNSETDVNEISEATEPAETSPN